jgi:ribosomal protein S18 acetylase RimI-like enzyme
MPITYHKLQPDEAALYRAVRLTCLQTEPDNFGTTYAEEAARPKLRFETFIEEPDDDHALFGAFDGAALIGLVGFVRQERTKTRHRGDIVQVYVDPRYRNQKVGEQLLRAVIEYAFALEGLEQLELGVVASNAAAIRLYEKLGFQSCGLHRNYFKSETGYTDDQFMQLFKCDYKR